jgi:hypothetical protein
MTGVPAVETPLPVSSLGVQRRVILKQGKDDLAFSFAMDLSSPKEDFFQAMDLITDVADRENLKVKKAEKLEALQVARAQPIETEREMVRMQAQRAAYIATREALHNRTGTRRLPFKLSEKDEGELKKFDDQLDQCRMSLRNFRRDVPIIEWEIACLDAQLAGRESPAKPKELEDVIDEMRFAA